MSNDIDEAIAAELDKQDAPAAPAAAPGEKLSDTEQDLATGYLAQLQLAETQVNALKARLGHKFEALAGEGMDLNQRQDGFYRVARAPKE